jgi:hypothetical protein
MIVQAEDKNRTAVETLIYVLLILSAVVSIGVAAVQPVSVPRHTAANNPNVEYRA